MREAQIEAYLVRRVKELGGEVRKVKWIGRRSAPDRLVLLPGGSIWIELKRSGGCLQFPKDARERAQHREHERMRAMGQKVALIDSFCLVDKVLGELGMKEKQR